MNSLGRLLALTLATVGPLAWECSAQIGCNPVRPAAPRRPTTRYDGPGDTLRPGPIGNPRPGDTRSPGTRGATPTGSPTAPGVGSGPTGALGPGVSYGGLDLSVSRNSWRHWWDHNRERYLMLRRRLNTVQAVTGSDEFYLGVVNEAPDDGLVASHQAIVQAAYPVLFAVLNQREKRSRAEVHTALMALAKLGTEPEESTKLISSYLDYSDLVIQETATISLGILAHRAAIKPLQDLLRDTEVGRRLVDSRSVPNRTRSLAAYALGVMGYTLTGPENRMIRMQVAQVLLSTLKSDDAPTEDVRVAAVISLGLQPFEGLEAEDHFVPSLRALLEDRRTPNIDLIRAHVPGALARMGARSTIPLMMERLADRKEQDHVRQSLVLALGEMVRPGDPECEDVVDALIRREEEKRSLPEHNFSAVALGEIGSVRAIRYLKQRLIDGKHTFKPWVALGLGIHAFHLPEGQLVDPQVPAMALHALKHAEDPSLREALAISLGLMGHRAASDSLVEELRRARVETHKGHAGLGLGLMNAYDTAEIVHRELLASLRKPEQLDRLSLALGMLRGRDTTADLHRMLDEHPTAATYAALGKALGRLRDVRSLERLVRSVDDTKLTAYSRAYSIVALGMMGNKEDWPWNTKIAANLNYLAASPTLTSDGDGVLDF